MPFVEEFDLLGCWFRRNGKGIQRTARTLKKGNGELLDGMRTSIALRVSR